VTAQNTTQVSDIFDLPPGLVRAQIDRVAEDLGPAAVKTGMLPNAEIVTCVAEAIAHHQLRNLVVDPVMLASSGARLSSSDAVRLLRERLLPLATVVTPNLMEAEVLLGYPIRSLAERRGAARDLVRLGARTAVVTGGHAEEDATDVLFDGDLFLELPGGGRIATLNTHGSGCVFASAIAAHLARGLTPIEAVAGAKELCEAAIRHALDLGGGPGPVNPLFGLPAARP